MASHGDMIQMLNNGDYAQVCLALSLGYKPDADFAEELCSRMLETINKQDLQTLKELVCIGQFVTKCADVDPSCREPRRPDDYLSKVVEGLQKWSTKLDNERR